MTILDLFVPKWENSNRIIREEALNEITDQNILKKIANKVKYPDTRKNAIRKITDQNILVEIIKKGRNIDTRIDAVMEINDQEILINIAKKVFNHKLWIAVIEKIIDQEFLKEIAKNNVFFDVRKTAVRNITDKEFLKDIAENDEDLNVRIEALNKLEDLKVPNSISSDGHKMQSYILGKDNQIIKENDDIKMIECIICENEFENIKEYYCYYGKVIGTYQSSVNLRTTKYKFNETPLTGYICSNCLNIVKTQLKVPIKKIIINGILIVVMIFLCSLFNYFSLPVWKIIFIIITLVLGIRLFYLFSIAYDIGTDNDSIGDRIIFERNSNQLKEKGYNVWATRKGLKVQSYVHIPK